MGYDFSGVKIHTGHEADTSAKQVNAIAYTHKNNIVFAEGQYQPGTKEGKRLLAHELTHVVQQGSTGHAPAVQRRGPPPPPVRPAPVRPPVVTVPSGPAPAPGTPGYSPAPPAYIPNRFDDPLGNAIARGQQERYEEDMRRDLERPQATLERGGAAPDFFTSEGSRRYSYAGNVWGSFDYTPRKYHVLDHIESDIGNSTTEAGILKAIQQHMPGLAAFKMKFGAPDSFLFQPYPSIYFPMIDNVPVYPEGFDPGGLVRTATIYNAVMKRRREVAALRESKVLAVLLEAEELALGTEKQRQDGACSVKRMPHAGGNAWHNDYADHVASVKGYGSVKDELLVTTPEGISNQFDTYNPLTMSDVWEVKTGHEWTSGDSRLPSAGFIPRFDQMIIGMDLQRLKGIYVASRCGFNFRYAFDICDVAKEMKIQWSNIPPIEYIPARGMNKEIC